MFGKVVAILVLLGIVVVCGVLYIGTVQPAWGFDFLTIQRRHQSEERFAKAFAVALRRNDPVVYEMVDSASHPRLDEWMHTHQPWHCTYHPDFFSSAQSFDGTYRVVLDCSTVEGGKGIVIESIVIHDMRILDWGEVMED